jgi:Uma2 family endonuclease
MRTTRSSHAACVKRLNESLARALGGEAMLGVQDPILLADSEPEPDISVLKRRDDYYADAKPGPADVLLVIEVADTTLEFDRENKFSIYAEAGIAEYWIVNLQDDVVEVYRNPAGMSYRSQSVARRGDSILLLHLPKVAIAVSDILPS